MLVAIVWFFVICATLVIVMALCKLSVSVVEICFDTEAKRKELKERNKTIERARQEFSGSYVPRSSNWDD